MAEDLTGRVAIVTGGATMIGAAIVAGLTAAGAAVVIGDIDREGGAAAARAAGPAARFVATDLRRDADIDTLVAAARDEFGGVDILVHGACTYLDRGAESTRAEWLAALDVNLVAAACLMRAALPEMKRRGGGAIVNLGSVSGKVAQSGRWLYPVSKAALHHLTRAQALDLAPFGVRVNTVSPGWTWSTAIARTASGERAAAEAVGGPFHALGRLGSPEDVAAAVVFLCSDAARFVTGADLPVDGGYMVMGPERAGRPNDALRDAVSGRRPAT